EGRTVFIDVNGDGVLNNPEGDNIASALAEEPWALTDEDGNYALEGVGPGTHLIRLVPQDGWSAGEPRSVTARSGQDGSGVNFASRRITGGHSSLHAGALADWDVIALAIALAAESEDA